MLTIRSDQMKVFDAAALRSFENEMVAHSQEFSPRLSKVIGETQLRMVVRRGIDHAQAYGFTNQGPVRLFIEMMMLFGSAFDTDPQYPWVAEILKDSESESQMERAARLYQETLDYLDKVVGPEDIFTLQALKRISMLAERPPSFSLDDFIPGMLRLTADVYPEKASYVGDWALELLIRKGIEEAAIHHMVTTHSKALFCVLMFAFGHCCADDPLYPWIARTLKDERILDPLARAGRLEKKTTAWPKRVVSWLEEGAQP